MIREVKNISNLIENENQRVQWKVDIIIRLLIDNLLKRHMKIINGDSELIQFMMNSCGNMINMFSESVKTRSNKNYEWINEYNPGIIIRRLSATKPVRKNGETCTPPRNCQVRHIRCICVLPDAPSERMYPRVLR